MLIFNGEPQIKYPRAFVIMGDVYNVNTLLDTFGIKKETIDRFENHGAHIYIDVIRQIIWIEHIIHIVVGDWKNMIAQKVLKVKRIIPWYSQQGKKGYGMWLYAI